MKKIFLMGVCALLAAYAMANKMGAPVEYPEYVYICGDATEVGWSADGECPMYNNGDGTYEYVGNFTAGEFKMLTTKGWTPSLGPVTGGESMTVGGHKLVVRMNYEDPDNKFTVTAGRYQVVLSLIDTTLTVADGTGMKDKNGKGQLPQYPQNLYLVGSGCGSGWSPENSIAFTTESDGVYALTTTLYAHTEDEEYNELKMLAKQSWGGTQYGPIALTEDITAAGVYTIDAFDSELQDNDHKYHNKLTETALYDLRVDLKNKTLSITKSVTPVTTMWMIGDAVGGWSFDENGVEMTMTEDSVFTATVSKLKQGELKFCVEKYFESETWGATEDNVAINNTCEKDIMQQVGTDHKFITVAGNNVQFTLNIKTKKLTVTYSEDPTGLGDVVNCAKVKKIIRNNQIIIVHEGKTSYIMSGAAVGY